jgi:hypothetical protein
MYTCHGFSLEHWGREIKLHFIRSNIASLPLEYVESNLSNQQLSELFANHFTFKQSLAKMVSSYYQMANDMARLCSQQQQIIEKLSMLVKAYKLLRNF